MGVLFLRERERERFFSSAPTASCLPPLRPYPLLLHLGLKWTFLSLVLSSHFTPTFEWILLLFPSGGVFFAPYSNFQQLPMVTSRLSFLPRKKDGCPLLLFIIRTVVDLCIWGLQPAEADFSLVAGRTDPGG